MRPMITKLNNNILKQIILPISTQKNPKKDRNLMLNKICKYLVGSGSINTLNQAKGRDTTEFMII